MKKRCVAICAALCLAFLPPARGQEAAVTLTVPVFFDSQIPDGFALVEAAVDELVFGLEGFHVDLLPLLRPYTDDQRRAAEIQLVQKQGTTFDLVHTTMDIYSGEEDLLPLNELIEAHGADILPLLPDDTLEALRSEPVCWLPSLSDYVTAQGIAMRRDIVEKYDVDLSSLTTWKDFDALFERIAPLEPDMFMICSYTMGRSLRYRLNTIGVHGTIFAVDEADPASMICRYATERYRAECKLFRSWYLKGYLPAMLALQDVSAYDLVRAGVLFSYVCSYKPGINFEASKNCRTDMVVVQISAATVTDHSLALNCWGIARDSQNPEEAMRFLALLYTNAGLINLLSYGIEGLHYQILPDGTITYPDGVDGSSVGYVNDDAWILPNQFPSHVWHGEEPDLWDRLDQFNRSAQGSPTLGFEPGGEGLQEKLDALRQVANRYAYGLESGQIDPDIYLDQMLAELEEAGLSEVQTELQRQYDAWRAGLGEDAP